MPTLAAAPRAAIAAAAAPALAALAGTVLAGPDWARAADRYDIQAPAGVSAISVTTWSP